MISLDTSALGKVDAVTWQQKMDEKQKLMVSQTYNYVSLTKTDVT